MNPVSQRGFSLLEVIVAFSILTLTLSTILTMFANGMRSTAVAQAYQQAQLLADTQLAVLQGTSPSQLQPGVAHGVVDGYAWESEVSLMEQEPPLVTGIALYRLSVVVRWSEGEKARHLRLGSLRLGKL